MVVEALIEALPYVAAGLTAAAISPEIASRVQQLKESEAMRREYMNQNYYRAFQAGSQARGQGKGFVENPLGFAAEQIPGIGAFESLGKGSEGQRKFVSAAAQELRKQGYSADRANDVANLAYRDFVARSSSEIPSALATEVGSEMLGGSLLKKFLPQQVERAVLKKELLNPLARSAAKSSALAGVYEGGLSIINQDVSAREFGVSRRTILPYGFKEGGTAERFAAQLERVGLGAGLGGALAGGFGAVIGGQRIPRKTVSRGAELLGDIIDPGEYPGDFIANTIRKRKGIREPTVRLMGIPEEIPRARIRTTGSNSLVEAFNGFMNANTQSRSKSSTQSRGKASTYIPGFSRGNVPAQIPSKPGSYVPGYSKEIFPGGKDGGRTYAKVPGETPAETDARTEVPTTAQVESYGNVPTSSVIYRGGAPLPLPFPPPQEGGSYISGGNQRAYINELRRGAKLFRRLI